MNYITLRLKNQCLNSAIPFIKWNHTAEVKIKLRWRRIFHLPRPCIREELTASIELGLAPLQSYEMEWDTLGQNYNNSCETEH